MGDIITNPPTTPNTVSDSWQPLVERDTMSYFGKNKITLTNWDASTTAPAIAQGSTIDINGSIARFTADDAIGGAPADGTVYLMFVVTGSTVTAEWTAEAPTWTADKGGWYTAAGNRCSGHNAVKAGTVFSNKSKFADEIQGDSMQTLAEGGAYIQNLYAEDATIETAAIGALHITDDLTLNTVTFSASAIVVLPVGIHYFSEPFHEALGGGATPIYLEVLISGTWRLYGEVSQDLITSVITSGTEFRLRNASSVTPFTYNWLSR